jgi:hypothetical protein
MLLRTLSRLNGRLVRWSTRARSGIAGSVLVVSVALTTAAVTTCYLRRYPFNVRICAPSFPQSGDVQGRLDPSDRLLWGVRLLWPTPARSCFRSQSSLLTQFSRPLLHSVMRDLATLQRCMQSLSKENETVQFQASENLESATSNLAWIPKRPMLKFWI